MEDEKLNEIYYERENEYTLAGSIYKGRVTRVLPGMQSAFVDVGLERDAFLYVTDFMEEGAVDSSEFDTTPAGGRRERGRRSEQSGEGSAAGEASTAGEAIGEGAPGADGTRRWSGRRRRGRGRGRSGTEQAPTVTPEVVIDGGFDEGESGQASGLSEAPQQSAGEDTFVAPHEERGARGFEPRGRRGRDDRGRGRQREEFGDERPEFVAKPAEPLLLPGESLARYRKDEHASGGETVDVHAQEEKPAVKPSNLIEAPLSGWDGGFVLPGETRSVRSEGRSQTPRSEVRSEAPRREEGRREERGSGRGRDRDRGRGQSRGRGRDERGGRRNESSAPALTPMPEELKATEVEFEPEEAAASHRVDTSTVSELRLDAPPVLEQVIEDETVFEDEVVEESESAPVAVAPAHDVTTISPTGEMVEEVVLEQQAVKESFATEAAPVASTPVVPQQNAPVVEERKPLEFAPGEGIIEEEIIDEDELISGEVKAHGAEGEFEEVEEESLGAEALGSMLRDLSIDEMTDVSPEEDDDEADDTEEFEESLTESGEVIEEEESFTDEDEAGDAVETEESVATDETPADAEPERRTRRRRLGRRGDRFRREDRFRRDGRRTGGERERSGPRRAPAGPIPLISDLLKPGQEVLVQIAKEPIAKKGARITSHIALPGRFLVFMPTVGHVGVSRKIESDEERRRLKQVLMSEKGDAAGGFIVRTAAEGASEEELRADLRFLINLWSGIKHRSEDSKPPSLIYHDLNLIERVLRDQVTDNFSAIWVDTEPEYERVLKFLQRFQPALIKRVKLYGKDTPLFEQFGITEEINKALRSKVWLKSGGSIVINQTEALVAIDINTGKYVGKTDRLEDTILKTNLDAIPEIVRQIRLRDLGGIIVIDFIDMDERRNRNKVMIALEDELKNDRAPSKVLQFNDFGLVAITRKRVKQSLERTLSTTCSICQGTGMVKNPVTVCNEIYVEMRKMYKQFEKGDILLRVHPEVVKQLKSNGAKWLTEMEAMSGKTILVKSDASFHPEKFDIQ